jgi:predicted nucleotide-binding protein
VELYMKHAKAISVVNGLLTRTENLAFGDEKHSALLQETQMIIRALFNSNEDYTQELNWISFYPYSIYGNGPSAHEEVESWKNGKKNLLTLLSTMKRELELLISLEDNVEGELETVTQTNFPSNKVFIVHGHDDAMKLDVARTLEALDLEAIILHEQGDLGLTVMEKFEQNALDCKMAVVLLSPDDLGFTKDSTPNEAKYRARQNVILELGYFVGKLGRSRVLPLVKNASTGSLEIPSDFAGVVYTPYDSGGGWKMKLLQYLDAAGYSVDANKLFRRV